MWCTSREGEGQLGQQANANRLGLSAPVGCAAVLRSESSAAASKPAASY